MLLLETGMAGTFIAFDLILFFVFWELVLVPMYFLIGIWGSANREYAAIKFFLYTLFGSIFMLLGFLAMFFSSDVGSGGTRSTSSRSQEFAAGGGFSNVVPAGRVRRGRARVRRSRCRCGRSTRGCPTRIPRRRRSARCCWPGSC